MGSRLRHPRSENSTQPLSPEEPLGPSLPCKGLSCRAGGQGSMQDRSSNRETCQTPRRGEEKQPAPLHGLLPFAEERTKNTGPDPGHRPSRLLAAPLPFFASLGSNKFLMLGSLVSLQLSPCPASRHSLSLVCFSTCSRHLPPAPCVP